MRVVVLSVVALIGAAGVGYAALHPAGVAPGAKEERRKNFLVRREDRPPPLKMLSPSVFQEWTQPKADPKLDGWSDTLSPQWADHRERTWRLYSPADRTDWMGKPTVRTSGGDNSTLARFVFSGSAPYLQNDRR